MLQHQRGVYPPTAFLWGGLEALDFLPRMRVGRVVLSAARWTLSIQEAEELSNKEACDRFVAIQELRLRRSLPRWILLEEGDHSLPIDLDNPLSVDAFVHALRRGRSAMLREMYPSTDQLCATGPEGRFCHELSVPFTKRVPKAHPLPPAPRRPSRLQDVSRDARSLPPGSDWVYVKIYGGPHALESALTAIVPDLLESIFSSGTVLRWFFVRYVDPHEHIRLRFNAHPARMLEVLSRVSEAFRPMLSSGALWKLQFDTYEREIERYGGLDATMAAEDIFFADSEAAINLLRQSVDVDFRDRWRLALLGVDSLISDYGYDLAAKFALMKSLTDSLYKSVDNGAELRRHLGNRFRTERRTIESLLFASSSIDPNMVSIRNVFRQRSARIAGPLRRIRALDNAGELCAEPSELIASYIHMHVNRMVTTSYVKTHEPLINEFLYRAYDSARARLGRAGQSG